MFDIFFLLTLFSVDEPRRAIDDGGVRSYIESRRPENAGPGKVVATLDGLFDQDAYADKLVIFWYEEISTSDELPDGLYAVVFFTEGFETSDILFIPASEVMPESVREYSSNGSELVIKGKRRVPGDDRCCPSAVASIALAVTNGKVVVLRGEYQQGSGRN